MLEPQVKLQEKLDQDWLFLEKQIRRLQVSMLSSWFGGAFHRLTSARVFRRLDLDYVNKAVMLSNLRGRTGEGGSFFSPLFSWLSFRAVC